MLVRTSSKDAAAAKQQGGQWPAVCADGTRLNRMWVGCSSSGGS